MLVGHIDVEIFFSLYHLKSCLRSNFERQALWIKHFYCILCATKITFTKWAMLLLNDIPLNGAFTDETMDEQQPIPSEFLTELSQTLMLHLSEENFGPSELAQAMHMSRSSLLRKVKKESHLSVSQFINQFRLEKAREMLRAADKNVSEVAMAVGFGSTSYFVKCFRERYGYPPGEENNRLEASTSSNAKVETVRKQPWFVMAGGLALIVVILAIIWNFKVKNTATIKEKAIVVLPFINDSGDSTNRYLIDGLMEATLNNLQKIKGLKVLSRTTSEKYRNAHLTAKEIAEELDVTYVVEGSGQKIGDKIILNIQLILGQSDQRMWTRQYRRAFTDLFSLQDEVARDIADRIEVVLTPSETARISKIATDSPEAYDLLMRGAEQMKQGPEFDLNKALYYFKEAIKKDQKFALAHALAAMSYYYLDIYLLDKPHLEDLRYHADQAMLYDASLGESYLAKAMFYLQNKAYPEALPFLEKGLEYSPNSYELMIQLADYYGTYMPNTGKYLQYALRAQRLNPTEKDLAKQSYNYTRIGNALAQTGFVDESIEYLNKAMELYPENAYASYILAFAHYAKSRDAKSTLASLQKEFARDSNRVDILKDIGKVQYYLRDFNAAARTFDAYEELTRIQHLDAYDHESLVFAKTYQMVGRMADAKLYAEKYGSFLERDKSAYNELGRAMYQSYLGNQSASLKHFEAFSKEDQIQYWVVLFLEDDILVDELKVTSAFKKIMSRIRKNFEKTREEIALSMEEDGVIL